MASRKSSRGAGSSPSPGSKRGEWRRCGSGNEAADLRGRGGGSRGPVRGSPAGRSGAFAGPPELGEWRGLMPPCTAAGGVPGRGERVLRLPLRPRLPAG